jgi:dienelactone hydrolase
MSGAPFANATATACLLCAIVGVAGCAGLPPTVVRVPGAEVSQLQIAVYDVRRNRDVLVPVSVYVPQNRAASKPGVIVMTGCDGSVSSGASVLMRDLHARGVVVAHLRSLEPSERGNSCERDTLFRGIHRSTEAFVLRDRLADLGLVSRDNVGLLGFSHGGWAISHAIFGDTQSSYRHAVEHPFAAAVAYYPFCQTLDSPRYDLLTPTLLLGGDADTWTPFSLCRTLERKAAEESTHGKSLVLVEYRGAAHSWDYPAPARYVQTYRGAALLAYDNSATIASRTAAFEWFTKHLRF